MTTCTHHAPKPTAGYISFACDMKDHANCDQSDCACPCHKPAPVVKPEPKPAQRTCGWSVPAALARDILLAGAGALFSIMQPDRRGRMVTTDYALQAIRHQGRFAGWRVTKFAPNGDALEEYPIDPSFGADPRGWECQNCPDWHFGRSRQPGHICKHIAAVATLLARCGIDPRTGA